jgi:hypothetical protein
MRNLLFCALAGALLAVAATPALGASGTIRTTDRSGHAVYKLTERKDPDTGKIRRSLAIKACDDRKDGAGIVAGVSGFGNVQSRGGVNTCGKLRRFSTTGRFRVRVCRQDASNNGAFEKCRTRTVS